MKHAACLYATMLLRSFQALAVVGIRVCRQAAVEPAVVVISACGAKQQWW